MSDFRIDLDLREVLRGLERMQARIKPAVKLAVEDCVDDLVRVSSEIAPHDRGILERSSSKEIVAEDTKVTATVNYAVRETYSGGNYNYAMKMHEGDYNLGPGSQAKPGTEGMSGRHYDVGNKYLQRPLEGETEAYAKHIKDEVTRAVQEGQ